MPSPVDLLGAGVAALTAIDGRIPGGVGGLRLASDAQLVELVREAQGTVRIAEGIVSAAAGEIARRSDGSGDESMARRMGERSAVGVVATQAGVSIRQAVSLVKVGEATRPNQALSGEELQPKRPHIAAGLAAGTLSVPMAELIEATLAKVAHVLWTDQADELEQKLVASAGQWSVADFTRYCKRIPDHLDPDGAEPREDALRAQARIVEQRLPNGLLRIMLDLDPEMEGWWKAAVAAKTAPRRRRTFDSPSGNTPASNTTEQTASNTTEQTADERTEERADTGVEGAAARVGMRDETQPDPMQAKLEAFKVILRQSLQQDDGQAAGIDVTMLVTIPLEALQTGLGAAHIADVDEPISAATARRLAAQANLIPQVLDGRSVVLDQGFGKRLFSKQQRYALATRDQGCTFPGCPLPPGMCEVNHIEKWRDTKPTNLNKGALMCGFHNRLMETGWDMELRDNIPWLTPPATIDPTRTPVRGGKPRLADIA